MHHALESSNPRTSHDGLTAFAMAQLSTTARGRGQRARLAGHALTRCTTLAAGLLLLATLTACGTSAPRLAVYDFGPGATQPVVSNRMAPQPNLLLSEVDAAPALDNNAVLYRLAYADAQQLRPYAQARWSMTPAQLLRQRLRETLGQNRSVLLPGDAAAPGTLALRLELEEFSQLFETPQRSVGLMRVRATLSRSASSSTGTSASGSGSPASTTTPASPARVLAQTSLIVQQPSPSADAAGGVQALAAASNALALQIAQWLQQQSTAEAAP